MFIEKIEEIQTRLISKKNYLYLIARQDNKKYDAGFLKKNGITPPKNFYQWHIKRQSEYSASRFLIKYALSKMNLPTNQPTYRKNLAPKWHENTKGCISHKDQMVIVIVIKNSDIIAAIDIERMMSEMLYRKIGSRIINSKEKEELEKKKYDKSFYYTLLFSAKESIIKLGKIYQIR